MKSWLIEKSEYISNVGHASWHDLWKSERVRVILLLAQVLEDQDHVHSCTSRLQEQEEELRRVSSHWRTMQEEREMEGVHHHLVQRRRQEALEREIEESQQRERRGLSEVERLRAEMGEMRRDGEGNETSIRSSRRGGWEGVRRGDEIQYVLGSEELGEMNEDDLGRVEEEARVMLVQVERERGERRRRREREEEKERRRIQMRRKEEEDQEVSGTEHTSKGRCCICLESPPSVLFLPCRHLVVCVSCSRAEGLGNLCPVCRRGIEEHISVYSA